MKNNFIFQKPSRCKEWSYFAFSHISLRSISGVSCLLLSSACVSSLIWAVGKGMPFDTPTLTPTPIRSQGPQHSSDHTWRTSGIHDSWITTESTPLRNHSKPDVPVHKIAMAFSDNGILYSHMVMILQENFRNVSSIPKTWVNFANHLFSS